MERCFVGQLGAMAAAVKLLHKVMNQLETADAIGATCERPERAEEAIDAVVRPAQMSISLPHSSSSTSRRKMHTDLRFTARTPSASILVNNRLTVSSASPR